MKGVKTEPDAALLAFKSIWEFVSELALYPDAEAIASAIFGGILDIEEFLDDEAVTSLDVTALFFVALPNSSVIKVENGFVQEPPLNEPLKNLGSNCGKVLSSEKTELCNTK